MAEQKVNGLPYGWTETYALRWAMKEIQTLTAEVSALQEEVQRLEATKANKVGRKPKISATVGR